MKKFLQILTAVLAVIFVCALVIWAYYWWQNRNAEKKATSVEGLKTFESRLHKFKVSYPKDLYMLTTEDTSIFPNRVRIADFENVESKPENNTIYEIDVYDDQNTATCTDIKECTLTKEFESQKFTVKPATLDDVPAVQLTNLENIGKNVITVLALWQQKIYRLDLSPSTVTEYENSKTTFEKIIEGFEFIDNPASTSLFTKRAYAATSCSNIDQQYAPSTMIHAEPLRTTNDTGQVFMPAQSTLCRIDVELENIAAANQATIWLYSGAGALLAQKTQSISNGWNAFVLDSSVNVTPDGEYKIQINILGEAGPKWRGGEAGSGGTYARGYAIMMGFPEHDFDFHFKEYYTTTTDEPTGNEETGGTTTTPKTTTKNKSATTVPEAKDIIPPQEPFNLKMLHLWLTGLAETYVDLEWDKVIDGDLGGYLIYYGNKSGDYRYVIDNGTANTIRVYHLLPGGDYYFTTHAYDKSGNLSGPSNEVRVSLIRNVIVNFWWVILILAGALIASIAGLIVVSRKEKTKTIV